MTADFKPRFILEANGLKLEYVTTKGTPDGFHRSGLLLIDGQVQEGNSVHLYGRDDKWKLEAISIVAESIDQFRTVPLRDFVGKLRTISVGVEGAIIPDAHAMYISGQVTIPSSLYAPEIPARHDPPIFGDYVSRPPPPGSMHLPSVGPMEAPREASPPTLTPPSSPANAPAAMRELSLKASIVISFSNEEWANPWSIKSWRKHFDACVDETIPAEDRADYLIPDLTRTMSREGISIARIVSADTSLAAALEPLLELAKQLISGTNRRARMALDAATLVEYFDFPPRNQGSV